MQHDMIRVGSVHVSVQQCMLPATPTCARKLPTRPSDHVQKCPLLLCKLNIYVVEEFKKSVTRMHAL